MKKLAIFDLDHTLIPIDSDFEWGEFLCRRGAVDVLEFRAKNHYFFGEYQKGTLNPHEYLEFVFANLSRFTPSELQTLHADYMQEVIQPALRDSAFALLDHHRSAGHTLLIITATNRFVTGPIAQALGVENLIAADGEQDSMMRYTGRLLGEPTQGVGKVKHLTRWLDQRGLTLDRLERSYFYSDSHNDLPLLELVSDPIATNPSSRLRDFARAKSWQELELFSND